MDQIIVTIEIIKKNNKGCSDKTEISGRTRAKGGGGQFDVETGRLASRAILK